MSTQVEGHKGQKGRKGHKGHFFVRFVLYVFSVLFVLCVLQLERAGILLQKPFPLARQRQYTTLSYHTVTIARHYLIRPIVHPSR